MRFEELKIEVEAGTIDTVLVAITDMQGRQQGKRFHAPFYLNEVASKGTEACGYLLATDVDMNTVGGYTASSWSTGYGDIVLTPDPATMRRVPWQPGTVMILANVTWPDGTEVTVSPRQILQRQLELLREDGYVAYAGTELEFVVFNDTYEDAWRNGYRDMTPANLYNVDYSLLGTGRVEPLLRRIRNEMAGAELVPESAKGECNLGQHEIAFRYAEAMKTADGHCVYKT
ncbi:MAG: glutamine synthetase, partial [Longispora sp.]|nr:glutamine synthetase [Longispora sp. (in: high G+C Gram-positive bacteria)]